MPRKPDIDSPRIKVKRKRKRLYEAAPQKPGSDAPPTAEEVESPTKKAKSSEETLPAANAIVHRYVAYSAGTALLPIPIVDVLAVTAIELKMLKQISDRYGMSFSEQRGKALIGSLIGGLHAGLFTKSLLKAVPVLGLGATLVPIAVLAGALTYAVGKVFVHHFETGGTWLDFDPATARADFETRFEEGKAVASRLRKRSSS